MPYAEGKVDFNLSTGKIIYTHYDYINSEYVVNKTKSEAFYREGIRLNLGNRNTKEIRIASPLTGKAYYF